MEMCVPNFFIPSICVHTHYLVNGDHKQLGFSTWGEENKENKDNEENVSVSIRTHHHHHHHGLQNDT